MHPLPHLSTALRWLLLAPALPYGGQAVIEGVRMKGEQHAAVAMRRRDGSIDVIDREVKGRFQALSKLPLLRGFFILADMLTLGTWALRESSQRYELDLEAAEAEKQGAAPEASKPVTSGPIPLSHIIMMAVSFAVAIFIFKLVPAMAATGVFSIAGWGPFKEIAEPTFGQQFLANLIEGLVKLLIFVGYVYFVGKLHEIARVFEYHGAEHIVINAYEDDETRVQDIRFIQQHSVAHPRCGTSFIAILILISIVLFTALDWATVAWFPALVEQNIPIWYIRWPLRILALPLLAGFSYEIIKAAFKYYGNPFLRPLLRFGMIFQALTTRRPSDDQVEVSLRSFNRARLLTEGIPEPEAAEDRAGLPEPAVS